MADDGGVSRREMLQTGSAVTVGSLGGCLSLSSLLTEQGVADGDDNTAESDLMPPETCISCDTELVPVTDGLHCPSCEVTHPRKDWALWHRDLELGHSAVEPEVEIAVPEDILEVAKHRAEHGGGEIHEYLLDYVSFDIVWKRADTGEVVHDER